MSDDDLIRRGDAMRIVDEDETAAFAYEQLRALPDADPLADPRVKALVEALADVYRLHMRRGPAWDHEPTKKVMDRATAALAAFKGDEA
jgi:hypothetical protein